MWGPDPFVWNDAAAAVHAWRWAAYAIFVTYVPLTFLGRALMSTRPAYDLQTPLKIWNCTLSILSLIGFATNLGYLLDTSFDNSYTSKDTFLNQRYGPVLFVFLLSKFLELADTAFIVLRKKDLCFLHWFHHLTVMIYCWFAIHDTPGTGYWFAQSNMLVHAVMYGYFAFATELRRASWFNPIVLTVLQIVQMVWGLQISTLYLLHTDTVHDSHTLMHAAYAIPMYASYLYLFCTFFANKYHFETAQLCRMVAYRGKSVVTGTDTIAQNVVHN
jgi:elongation of very long chain fatty acids protein 6